MRNRKPGWLAALVLYFGMGIGTVFAQAARIGLDGYFDDWQNLAPLHTDAAGDAGNDQLDLDQLWAANDGDYLFIRFSMRSDEISLQSGNDLTLYLDTDNNSNTGLKVAGLGAELAWRFGDRQGTFYSGGQSAVVYFSHVGFVAMPTVTSDQFEISFERDIVPSFGAKLFPAGTIRIALASNATNGDRLPDSGQSLTYTFDDSALPDLPVQTLQMSSSADFRLMSYNVERDALFDTDKKAAFTRMMQAADPQIIALQEVYQNSAEQTRALIAEMLPAPAGKSWSAARVESDLVLVSQFPIKKTFEIETRSSSDYNAAFLLDLRPDIDSDLLLLNAHLKCCSGDENDAKRQYEIDAISAFVREAKKPGGVLTLAENTPIILAGDMNLVGASENLRTLVAGEIVNTGTFGQSAAPDWDGSAYTDLAPRHVATPMYYTWAARPFTRNFAPSRIDFIFYTASVLTVEHGFALETTKMPADSLAAYGLQPEDSNRGVTSDHVPLLADFRLRITNSVADAPAGPVTSFRLQQNYPNPFNPQTRIAWTQPGPGFARLSILDVNGREVRVLISEKVDAGEHELIFDASGLASGVYFYRLSVDGVLHATRKMLYVR